MVQIGNFHIGEAQTAKLPVLASSEAFLLWDNLVSRYDIILATQLYINHVHDLDFRVMLEQGLTRTLEKQVDIMEKEMNKYKLPLPDRPPKSVSFIERSNAITDEYVFQQLFSGIQNFLGNHIRTIRMMVVNDPLRKIFIKFLQTELELFDDICKYGKLKGWLEIPPVLKTK